MVAAFLLLAFLAGTTYLASAHPITVDGTSGEWFNRLPLTDDSGLVARNAPAEEGEHIWLDRPNDERTAPDPRVDLRQVRYTGTGSALNVLVKVADLDISAGAGAPQAQLALDLDRTPGSGSVDFVAGAETQVANAVRWEYLLQTRLGSGGGNVAVWANAAGPPVFAGTSAASTADESIELSVPWSALGLSGPPSAFNATVAMFRSGTDDTTSETAGSDALDVVSDYGDPGTAPGTAAEVGDGTVDYFGSVSLTAAGEARGSLVVSAFSSNVSLQPAAEWIEVANATAASINIAAFKLGDATTPGAPEAMFAFPAGSQLVAGQRFRVARDGAAFEARFGSLPNAEFINTSAAPDMNAFGPWSAGALDLDDVGDEIVVLDGSNATVDVVPYGTGSYTGVGTTAAPAVNDVLQRNPSLRDTDAAADFSTAACAGTKTWDGGGGNDLWTTAANWSGDTLPGSGDHVCISNTALPAITFNTTTTVLSVTSAETLSVTGGTLTLSSPTQPSTLDAFNFSGGTVQGGGNLTVNGPATWSNGGFSAASTSVKTTFNGPLALNPGDHQLQVRQLELNGDTTWTGGRILIGGGASITNTAGHTFAIQTDDDVQFWFAPNVAFNNAGVVTKETGNATTIIDNGVLFNNTGSTSVASGTLELSGGGTSTGAFSVPSSSTLVFSGSSNITHNLNAGSTLGGAGSVRFGGGTTNVNGTSTHTGPLLVSGGVANVTPALNGNALIASGGTLALNSASSASSLALSGGTIQGAGNLTVNGTTTWSSGGFAADSTSVKTILSGAVLLNGSDHQLQVRQLDLNGDTTWTGARILIGNGAAITNTAGHTFAIQTDDDVQFWFGSGSTFNNAGILTKQSGTATTSVDNGVVFNNTGSTTVASGTLELGGGGASAGSFAPLEGGTLTFTGSSNITHNLNAGSSLAGAGSLRFAGGTTNVNGASTHTGPVVITNGAANFAPPLNNNPLTASGGTLALNSASSVPSLTVSGGTIQGAGNLTVNGATTWSSGGFAADSTSVKTIFNGPLTLNGTDHQLQVRELELNANATWTSARILIGDRARITNGAASTFAIQTDDDVQFWFGSATAFNNAGAVTKQSGTATTTVGSGIAFNNTGSVTVASGTLDLNGGGTSTGSFSVPSGSTLQFSGGTSNLNAGSTVNASGLVRFSGGTANVVGGYDVTSPTEVTNGTVNFNVTGPLDAVPATTTRLVQTGGTVGGNDTLEISELFTWHGGTQTDNGQTTIKPAATLELTGGNRILSGKRMLFNEGEIVWTVPGTWGVGGGTPSGATIRNAGTFEFRDGQTINNNGGEVQLLNVPGGLVSKVGAPGGQTVNFSAEDGAADPNGNVVGSIPGWARTDNFTVIPYGAAGFPAVADAPAGAGANFFAGGPNNAQSRISQTLDISGSAAAVDAGELTAVLEGDLGGTGSEDDAMTVNAVFLTGTTELGHATIGPVLAADRDNVTGFVFSTTSGVVPAGTRTIRLEAIANRAATGTSYNNAYADRLKLRVRDLESFAGSSTIDIPFDNDASTSGVDVAHGTLNLSGGDVNESVGRFDVADGAALQFGGGPHDLGTTSSLSGAGTIRFTSGTANLLSGVLDIGRITVTNGTGNFNTPATADVLRQSAGIVGGSGLLTLTGPGASSWTSGQMLDSGTTRVASGVTLNLSGTGTKTLRRVLDNAGTVTWSGTGEIHSGNATTFNNSGLFEIQNNQTYHHNHGGVSQLNNTGTIRKSAGTGVSDIDPPVDNDGSVEVLAGTLSFDGGDGPNASTGSFAVVAALQFGGGTNDLDAASSLTGAGLVRFAGGVTNVGGGYDLGATEITNGTGNFNAANSVSDVLNQSAGILGGSGLLTLTGPGASSWTSGQMLDSGTTRVASDVTLNLSGTGTKTLRRVLDNAGTVTWSGTGEIHSGNATTFNNSGLFEIQNNQTYHHNHGGVSQLNNTGTIRKSAGTGTSDIDPPVDNDGSVEVLAGTLSFDGGDGPNASTGSFAVGAALQFGGGTNDLDAASSLTGAGLVRFAGGVTNVGGGYDLGATEITNGTGNFNAANSVSDVLNQSAGILGGSGLLTLTGPGASSWTSGQMLDSGTTRVASDVTLNLSGTGTKTLRRVLDNAGTVTWSGTGEIHSGNATTFNNSGLFEIQNNQTYHHNHGGVSQLNNTGTIRKIGTGPGTDIHPPVNSTGGTIDVQSGTLSLLNLANYDNGTKTLTGGAYLVKDTLRFSNADVQTNAAKIVLDGPDSKVQDRLGTPNDALRNFATNAAGGDFSIVGGRNLAALSAPNLTNHGVLRGTGTYFKTVTNNGTVAPGASPGILTVSGNYTQSASGTLEIEVAGTATAGTDYDRLVVTGTATLNGSLAGKLIGGFLPVTGVGIDVVTAAVRSQAFALVTSTPSPLPGAFVFEARYDPTTVKLFAVPGGGAADDSVAEGAATKTITVTLSAPSTEQVTVNFATADGTATADLDYEVKTGLLTFAPGDTSETFDVTIADDSLDEANETFLVNLSSPSNTVLTDTQATITITDDDAPPTLSIDDVIQAEGSAGTTAFVFDASLSQASGKTVTVDFATADDTATQPVDYTPATGTVTFAPGETTKPVTVDVHGDTQVEFDERFFVDLSNAANATIARSRGLGAITDDDQGGGTAQLSIGDVSVTEGDSGTVDATFTVSLAGTPTTPVSVSYATADGTATAPDYGSSNGTLVFGLSTTPQTITVPVTGENLEEATERFTVNLSSPVGASLSDAQGVGTIADDDAAPLLVTEAIVTTPEDPLVPVQVNFVATDNDDPDSSLTFEVVSQPQHGSVSAPVGSVAQYTPDPNFNGFDSFTVEVFDGTNSDVGVIAIEVAPVNDAPFATNVSRAFAEDTSETIVLPATDVEGSPLTYAASGATNGSVSVNGNEATFTPAANFHGPASFTFKANDGSLDSNAATASLTITPVNDAPVAADDATSTPEETAKAITLTSSDVDGGAATFSIVGGPAHGTLSAVAGNQVTYTPDVNYNGADSFRFKANDGMADSTPATISIAVTPVNDAPVASDDDLNVGQDASALVDALGNDNDVDAGDVLAVQSPTNGTKGTTQIEAGKIRYFAGAGQTGPDSFSYTVSDGHGGTDTGTVNVDILAGSVVGDTFASVDDASLVEGDSAERVVNVTVRLSRLATEPAEIRVSTNAGTATPGIDFTPLNSLVPFAVGEQLHTVPVKVLGDTLDEANETFTLVISSSDGAVVGDGIAQVTITDDDDLVSLSASAVNVTEGNSGSQTVLLPVTLSQPSGKTVHVDFATADGTATQPSDYTATGGTLTFGPGETSKAVQVVVGGDESVEPDELLTVNLSGADEATIAGSAGTISILNDDAIVQPPPPAPPIPTADLALTMAAPATSAVDRSVTYDLGIRNNGPATATGVVLTDALPSGLQFVSGSVGQVACFGAPTVVCPVGTLPSGGTATVRIVATTTEAGIHTNTATVSGAQPDPAAGNNSASATTRVPVPVPREPAGGGTGGCTQRGTAGDDVLRGGGGVDVLCGLGGNDIMIGFGGNDKLLGGAGNDRVLGGAGNDNLKGGNGSDDLLGGAGKDRLDGGRGPDTLAGERGDDVLLGSFGNDFLVGGKGKDRVLGGPGKDRMRRDARDTTLGGPGGDRCITAGVVARCP